MYSGGHEGLVARAHPRRSRGGVKASPLDLGDWLQIATFKISPKGAVGESQADSL